MIEDSEIYLFNDTWYLINEHFGSIKASIETSEIVVDLSRPYGRVIKKFALG